MKRITKGALHLTAETIRTLTSHQLERVGGGEATQGTGEFTSAASDCCPNSFNSQLRTICCPTMAAGTCPR